MGVAPPGHLLFVAGMHRAGTSALCAALHACGARFAGELLPAMAGVNDEGFWESAEVVAINDRALQSQQAAWYAVPRQMGADDWSASCHDDLRQRIRALLDGALVPGAVSVLKDPRFCLTLPLWLAMCRERAVPARVAVVWREPLEVARSLQRRDAFPVGYGLRLQGIYLRALQAVLPSDAVFVGYRALLDDAPAALEGLAAALPLDTGVPALERAVRGTLRHQHAEVDSFSLFNERGELDIDAYQAEVERRYPVDEVLRQSISVIVARGQAMTGTGAAHSAALSTIADKDRDIAQLTSAYEHAIATIADKDRDIAQLTSEYEHAIATIEQKDRDIERLAVEHTHALDTIAQRDEQLRPLRNLLKRLRALPVLGHLLRGVGRHESR